MSASAATSGASSRISAATPAKPRGAAFWAGWALSALPGLALLGSAAMKLSHAPDFVAKWVGKLGFPESLLTTVGLIELLCTVLFLLPPTAFVGAAALSAYLGGAVVTHLRVQDGGFGPAIVLGLLVWAGLYLRQPVLRQLLPFGRGR